ncbi:MAG TPA: hypothetical protein VGM07_20230 [Stellaceae bacterium]
MASERAAAGAKIWTHLRGANKEANPELLRIALKLATGASKRQYGRYSDGDPSTTRQAQRSGGRRSWSGPNSASCRARVSSMPRAGFDVVIACAFNFDARSAELDRIPILKARMNPDLHMAGSRPAAGGLCKLGRNIGSGHFLCRHHSSEAHFRS